MGFQYSANVGFLWSDRPLPERIFCAEKAGFDAVECHFPYEHDASEIKTVLDQTGLQMIGINTGLGPEGYFGLSAISGMEKKARELIDQAIEYAAVVDAKNINVVAGLTNGKFAGDHPEASKVYRENLCYACEKAQSYGKTIVIEPLSPRAVAGYHFYTIEQGVEIVESVGMDNLKLMLDFFHAQIVQGDLETLIRQYAKYLGHVQLSAVHDRGEPDNGEINYPYLLNILVEAGYTGYIGAEYKPRGKSVESGLSWLQQFRETLH